MSYLEMLKSKFEIIRDRKANCVLTLKGGMKVIIWNIIEIGPDFVVGIISEPNSNLYGNPWRGPELIQDSNPEDRSENWHNVGIIQFSEIQVVVFVQEENSNKVSYFDFPSSSDT